MKTAPVYTSCRLEILLPNNLFGKVECPVFESARLGYVIESSLVGFGVKWHVVGDSLDGRVHSALERVRKKQVLVVEAAGFDVESGVDEVLE